MPTTTRDKLFSQASPGNLIALRKIAESEGRSVQEILDEALREYIERKEKSQSRRQPMDAFSQSLSEFDQLYRELAK